jgi:hypothetical protein
MGSTARISLLADRCASCDLGWGHFGGNLVAAHNGVIPGFLCPLPEWWIDLTVCIRENGTATHHFFRRVTNDAHFLAPTTVQAGGPEIFVCVALYAASGISLNYERLRELSLQLTPTLRSKSRLHVQQFSWQPPF